MWCVKFCDINYVPWLWRYEERLSKNHKVNLKCFQEQCFKGAILSYDLDGIATFKALMAHMPPNLVKSHMFLKLVLNP